MQYIDSIKSSGGVEINIKCFLPYGTPFHYQYFNNLYLHNISYIAPLKQQI